MVGPDDAEPEAVGRRGRVHARHLVGDDRLLHGPRAGAAVLLRPAHAQIARLVELPVPPAPVVQRPDLLARQVLFEPGAHLLPVGDVLGGVVQIHAASLLVGVEPGSSTRSERKSTLRGASGRAGCDHRLHSASRRRVGEGLLDALEGKRAVTRRFTASAGIRRSARRKAAPRPNAPWMRTSRKCTSQRSSGSVLPLGLTPTSWTTPRGRTRVSARRPARACPRPRTPRRPRARASAPSRARAGLSRGIDDGRSAQALRHRAALLDRIGEPEAPRAAPAREHHREEPHDAAADHEHAGVASASGTSRARTGSTRPARSTPR